MHHTKCVMWKEVIEFRDVKFLEENIGKRTYFVKIKNSSLDSSYSYFGHQVPKLFYRF